ncbi:porin, partial [Escherichia coli]|uniref:porin n=1 Tax=Escherichia coli TaxID=562 RepID=UPI00165688F6
IICCGKTPAVTVFMANITSDVGATYYFNKNMSTYVDYKINLLDEDDSFYAANGISTDDIVALGLVYQF